MSSCVAAGLPSAWRKGERVQNPKLDEFARIYCTMNAPLDSRQLRAFASLAQTGSFTRTARQLHLSQSAISHSIKALEDEVRCRLLDRVGKTVTLTLAGEQLLGHAQRILTE